MTITAGQNSSEMPHRIEIPGPYTATADVPVAYAPSDSPLVPPHSLGISPWAANYILPSWPHIYTCTLTS